MKKLLFFLTLFAITVSSQLQAQSVSGFSFFTNQRNTGNTIYSRDTLVNLDTIFVYLTPGNNAFSLFKIDAILRCDSISGATAGTAYLQFAGTGAGLANGQASKTLTNDQVMWYNVSSVTLDGAGRTQYRLTGDLTSSRARLLILTPNSTARRMMITYAATLKKVPGGI